MHILIAFLVLVAFGGGIYGIYRLAKKGGVLPPKP
jgi:hypothetical protein